ncbi:MAG TPA: YraN family protein [Anaerolineaceae bacterium]|nr:YraN family protein [Anaerolineaceae bacterium]HPN53793.1 YraN family protein [Anaerolineaceae bacterium]
MGGVNRGDKQSLGRWGEEQAEAHLTGKQFQVLFRNFRTPYGEIDLVCLDQTELVFVEVKTRSSTRYGNPEAAVTEKKLGHLIQSAEVFLQDHPDYSCAWRVDVVAILTDDLKTVKEIIHFENVTH